MTMDNTVHRRYRYANLGGVTPRLSKTTLVVRVSPRKAVGTQPFRITGSCRETQEYSRVREAFSSSLSLYAWDFLFHESVLSAERSVSERCNEIDLANSWQKQRPKIAFGSVVLRFRVFSPGFDEICRWQISA